MQDYVPPEEPKVIKKPTDIVKNAKILAKEEARRQLLEAKRI